MLALDSVANAKYRNPLELDQYIRSQIAHDGKRYYVFIDEIQFVMNIQNPYVDHKEARITFVDVVIGLMELSDVDVYITGSNSHMLSSDILYDYTYGGMPRILSMKSHGEKSRYLKDLCERTYIKDVLERHHINQQD